MAETPYRSPPDTGAVRTGTQVLRLLRPGTRRWAVFITPALLALVAWLVASYVRIGLDCDTGTRSCLVTEHRVFSTSVRKIERVRGARKDSRGSVELLTNDGVEPTLRGSFVAPFHWAVDEFIGQLTRAHADGRGARHVSANLLPHPWTVTWMSLVGLLSAFVGYVSLKNGLHAFRGVPVRLHFDRGSIEIPPVGNRKHAREVPMMEVTNIRIFGSSVTAMFVILSNDDQIQVTPLGKEKGSTFEPSRRKLAEALRLDLDAVDGR